MIPLCLATRRIILVGDHRQLPHLLEPDIERELEASEEAEMLSALRQSMFERLFNYLRAAKTEDGFAGREITLDTQFRMHHVLGTFVSKAFMLTTPSSSSGAAPMPCTTVSRGTATRWPSGRIWAATSTVAETAGRSKSRLPRPRG